MQVFFTPHHISTPYFTYLTTKKELNHSLDLHVKQNASPRCNEGIEGWEGEFKGIKVVRKKGVTLKTPLNALISLPSLLFVTHPQSPPPRPPKRHRPKPRARCTPVRVDTLNSGRHFTILRQLLLALWSENHVHLLTIEFGHKLHTCKLLQVIGEAQQ